MEKCNNFDFNKLEYFFKSINRFITSITFINHNYCLIKDACIKYLKWEKKKKKIKGSIKYNITNDVNLRTNNTRCIIKTIHRLNNIKILCTVFL